ncbi:MAG: GspH/FimT family pseudopilin [Xanthomonadaceae bacterium]|nr:GspH/FimT family pseudopilin [Xanthomonadaceae bacterium]
MALRRAGKQHGVTLVEQIMVIAILGVLAAIALPPLARLLHRNRVQVAQTDFMAAMQHARNAAITSGQPTLFCPTRNGTQCSGGTRWESGWLIGHDPDRDGQPNSSLRTGAAYAGITILGDSGRPLVRFRADGSALGTTNTLRFCSRGQSEQALVVVISNVGRVRGAKASAVEAARCATAQ